MLACALSALAMVSLPLQQAVAEQWPTKPVTMIVPFAPGGPTDTTARVLGEGLSEIWKQPVIVENRAGAGGTIGAHSAARANADGYTVILGVTGSHGIAGALFEKLSYSPSEDFDAVAKVVIYPNAIIAHPDVPANTLQELIELAKTDQAYQVYGTDGSGTASHLTMEMLRERAGFAAEVAQYKGSTPLLNDLMGGFVPYGITGLPSVEPHVESGALKVIAITTAEDYSGKGYKTIAEQGFPGFAAAPWSGIFAPAGTPKHVLEKIASDIKTVMTTPKTVDTMTRLGLTPMPIALEEFEADLERERAAWAKAVEISGIEPL